MCGITNITTSSAGFLGSSNAATTARPPEAWSAAAGWLASQNLTDLRGPVSPSIDYQAGVLVDGFELPPAFMMPYNPGYYGQLMAECGLAKSQDLFAFQIDGAPLQQVLPRLSASAAAGRAAPRDLPSARASALSPGYRRVSVGRQSLAREPLGIRSAGPGRNEPHGRRHGLAAGARTRRAGRSRRAAHRRGPALPDYNPRVKQIGGRLLPFGFVRLLTRKRQNPRRAHRGRQRPARLAAIGHRRGPDRRDHRRGNGARGRERRVLLDRRIEPALPQHNRNRRRPATKTYRIYDAAL